MNTITLVVDSEGDRLVGGSDYPPAPQGCKNLPPERQIGVTYRVPDDPPPSVRLTATAVDHVGLRTFRHAEFPTGEWYGTLEWTHEGAKAPGEASGRKVKPAAAA